MQAVNFDEIVDHIRAVDTRFEREAYRFVREALDYTQRKVHKDKRVALTDETRHITGQQLLSGIREHALDVFGPMTLYVFHEWGVRRCEDFGEIVFNLVDHGNGMFGKTSEDSRDDFKDGYDFEAAFREPFLPARRAGHSRREMREA